MLRVVFCGCCVTGQHHRPARRSAASPPASAVRKQISACLPSPVWSAPTRATQSARAPLGLEPTLAQRRQPIFAYRPRFSRFQPVAVTLETAGGGLKGIRPARFGRPTAIIGPDRLRGRPRSRAGNGTRRPRRRTVPARRRPVGGRAGARCALREPRYIGRSKTGGQSLHDRDRIDLGFDDLSIVVLEAGEHRRRGGNVTIPLNLVTACRVSASHPLQA